MKHLHPIHPHHSRHRGILASLLCLLAIGLSPVFASQIAAPLWQHAPHPSQKKTTPSQKRSTTRKGKKPVPDDRVYLVHSDELRYDQFGLVPDAQIVKGKVQFHHQGARMWCDSAYFYQSTNSFRAFGHVRMQQGDTLSLTCDRAYYDGQGQMMEARQNVILKHRGQTLHTDSLNYDRLYNNAYFFEGGTLTDKNQKLVADWGQYNTQTRQASFYYNVKMLDGQRLITTDTLHYDTRTSLAHVTGPSRVTSKTSTIDTQDAYFNTHTDQAQLFGRSTVNDQDKTITGDSLYYDDRTGLSHGHGRVVYVDKHNRHTLHCEHMEYNEKTGFGFATGRTLAKDYSQGDTLYVHADSIKLYTLHLNTDTVQRHIHAYHHVRAYRTDLQAVCDSLVITTRDSCLTLYRHPIVWNANRQLTGQRIKVYLQDSLLREARVLGQALSIEQLPDSLHYNQISSRDMYAYFTQGVLRRDDAIANVRTVYYTMDEADSTLIGLNYLETDTLRLYLNPQKKLQKIWTCKFEATLYPMTQIPPTKPKLDNFVWYSAIRPRHKDDLFEWRPYSPSISTLP